MGVKFSNNGHSTLAASISSSDTSLTVASGHGARFPSLGAGDYFYATLIDASNNLEIVKCTARSSDVLTIARGQESTTARAYAIGDRIELRVTAQGITDATDIDTLLPSQTGNSGEYLTTDGSNLSWGTITDPTPAVVSDTANTSTGYFDLPSGTTAQRSGTTPGQIRFNTDTRALERYHDFANSGSDGWYTHGDNLVCRHKDNGGWTTLDLTWTGMTTQYAAYRVIGSVMESDAAPWDLRLQLFSGSGTLMSGSYYYGTSSYSAPNDGFDGAVGNVNPNSFLCISSATFNTGDSGYAPGVNGENTHCFDFTIICGIPNTNVHTKVFGQGQSYSHSFASVRNEFGGVMATATTVVNGINTIGGFRLYPSGGTIKSVANATAISVFGIPGFEVSGY